MLSQEPKSHTYLVGWLKFDLSILVRINFYLVGYNYNVHV